MTAPVPVPVGPPAWDSFSWQRRASLTALFHTHKVRTCPGWTLGQTGLALGFAPQLVSKYLKVSLALSQPRVSSCQTLNQACELLLRRWWKEHQHAMEQIIGPGALPPDSSETILNKHFSSWASSYSGPKFNLIHCDFPFYPIEEYHQTMVSLLLSLDKIMSTSGHLLFWYPPNYLGLIRTLFRDKAAGLRLSWFPLIWVKSDKQPSCPGGPIHTYETCLLFTRGSRDLVKTLPDSYVAPIDHSGAKPEPMLRHFLSMFIDHQSRVLDPLCRTGNSIRAAETLGAQQVLGLEPSEELCFLARTKLSQARNLSRLSRVMAL